MSNRSSGSMKSSGSNLVAFGDPVLDAMYEASKAKTAQAPRVKLEVAEKCPSCGCTRILTKGYYATLCKECHNSISELAENTPW